MQNLHNHPIGCSLNHKLPVRVISDITKTLENNPYLTTHQIQCGQGLGYRTGSIDIAGSSYDCIDHHRKKIIRGSCAIAIIIVTGCRKTDPNRTFGISRITNFKYLTHCESILLRYSHAKFAV